MRYLPKLLGILFGSLIYWALLIVTNSSFRWGAIFWGMFIFWVAVDVVFDFIYDLWEQRQHKKVAKRHFEKTERYYRGFF